MIHKEKWFYRARDTGRRLAYPNQTRLIHRAINLLNPSLIVVLDSARYRPIKDDEKVEPVRSPADNTWDWVAETFPDYHPVKYVSGAPPVHGKEHDLSADVHGRSYIPSEHFQVVEGFRDCWVDNVGNTDPRCLKNKAVDIAEKEEPENMVVHFFNPHSPYFIPEKQGWKRCRVVQKFRGKALTDLEFTGAMDQVARALYRHNYQLAMLCAEKLADETHFSNVYFTADHGEMLGDRRGKWGHSHGIPYPETRIVPWVQYRGREII